MSNSGTLARRIRGHPSEAAIPANAYLTLTSLSGTRPHAVPDDVRGFRREDPAGRCAACRHHARFEGPAPATRYTGEAAVVIYVGDVVAGAFLQPREPGRNWGGEHR
ncbi:hypothetical protein Maq22A_c13250 [Methylobacterium aquaticum]|uniref:Uncharacterized protein n=1 Tax=Methylobacterium aquaticum TaxID=270351 RepID=A0A0C6FL45_9HYPH|nr:hypothetical protein Maq22A_c13250 [Methylobacterium aquaticum]